MQKKNNIAAFLPLASILVLTGAVLSAGYLAPFFWPNLQESQSWISDFRENHPVWTPLLFMAFYILCALVSFPGIFLLSLFAGFLFAQPFSTLYVTVASTVGGSLLFLAAKSAFGEPLFHKATSRLEKLKKGFQANATSYLLFLRLFPFFPYWLVNLAAAYFAVPFLTFAWTTFIGMIPSAFLYAQAGEEFFHLINNPDPITPARILNPPLLLALSALSLLSLVPLWAKKQTGRAD
jgi:uncharacterized membrane protein YdjX (TVP38/TMEM64 family)